METKAEENDYTELLRVHFPWYPTYRQILNEFNKIILLLNFHYIFLLNLFN